MTRGLTIEIDGDRREERRVGRFELEAHGQRIDRRDVLGLQDLEEGAGRRQRQRQHAAEGIDHVLGGERAAVVELDAGRSLNSQIRPSGDTVWLSASHGTIFGGSPW